MAWHARLQLEYTVEHGRCVARHRHEGPLRILQSLYPEGDAVCHHVLVHPPGGLVGGDTLELDVRAGAGAHGLLTTPGATRFYRSDGATARQHTRVRLDAGARLEWLPLEAICHRGCLAENRLGMELAAGAELMGWDITALGLPLAGEPFDHGVLQQHLELEGAWLERGRIAADDQLLLDSPVGLAGHRCLATLFFCTGTPIARARAERALEAARAVLQAHALCATTGATQAQAQVLVVRVLAPVVEPAMALLRQVRAAWRRELWALEATAPRIWST